MSAERFAFCVPNHDVFLLNGWHFVFCVPPLSSRSIFRATVQILRRISDERFVFCVGGNEFPANGSRFASCHLLPRTISALFVASLTNISK